MRLTPQHAFSITATANMLRTIHEHPGIRLEGGFTKKRVLADARAFLSWDTSIQPQSDTELALAYALDQLAEKARRAPPMTSNEVRAMLRRKGK